MNLRPVLASFSSKRVSNSKTPRERRTISISRSIDDTGYPALEEIDWSKLRITLIELTFFDDLFLGMQATNIAVVDQMATNMEYELLQEYFETERTPVLSAIRVSAVSQMWIFSVYEVLRTWRDRVWKFRTQLDNGMLEQYAIARESGKFNNASLIRARQARRVLADPSILAAAEADVQRVKHAYDLCEELRMNLAKHQAAGKGNIIPPAPGYGRIDGACGALNFDLVRRDGSFMLASRRDLAEAIRDLPAR